MSTDGGEPGKGAGSKSSGSKANKQLRELQRLMAWAWDSRQAERGATLAQGAPERGCAANNVPAGTTAPHTSALPRRRQTHFC